MAWQARRSFLHLHTLPEGHAALDQVGFGLGLGVEPHGVGQHVAVDQQAVVMRLALPGAGGLVIRKGDVLALERVRGEVVVAFHHDGVVTLGDDGVVPGGFHTECDSHFSSISRASSLRFV